MSVVTNLILTCGLDDHKIALKLNLDACAEGKGENVQRFVKIDGQAVGGSKCLELSLFAAGVNYCDLDAVLKVIEAAKWKSPEEVALWAQGQEDVRPAMYGFIGAVAYEGVEEPRQFERLTRAVSDGGRREFRWRERSDRELMRLSVQNLDHDGSYEVVLLDTDGEFELSLIHKLDNEIVAQTKAEVKDSELSAAHAAQQAAETEVPANRSLFTERRRDCTSNFPSSWKRLTRCGESRSQRGGSMTKHRKALLNFKDPMPRRKRESFVVYATTTALFRGNEFIGSLGDVEILDLRTYGFIYRFDNLPHTGLDGTRTMFPVRFGDKLLLDCVARDGTLQLTARAKCDLPYGFSCLLKGETISDGKKGDERMVDVTAVEEKLFVESPWYGVLEIIGEPGAVHTECWDGDHVATYVTETLQPLTPEAALMLYVPWGTKVWDDRLQVLQDG